MGWKGIFLGTVVLAAAVCFALIFMDSPKPDFEESGWWGKGIKTATENTEIKTFEVQVQKETLVDLQRRLKATRLGEDLENNSFDYGFQVGYMKEVLEYWQTKYDWKKHEAILNNFPQYKTKIEGINVHFLRVKPVNPGAKKTRPLLLVHGWPGSVWEFYKLIPILTDPTKHGFNAEYAFEVICPSIPGYGFSEAPHQKGFNQVAAARVLVKLMKRLGHNHFYFQGGDWGSIIGTQIAAMYPQNVQGLHINMIAPAARNIKSTMKQLLLAVFPSLFLEDGEKKTWPGMGTKMGNLLRETGYMHIQATRPDTVAYGLNDSPVGLAAYILEKFSIWTNQDNRLLPDGGLTRSFTLDELLTNVMIYWVTGSIGSSMRFYREVLMSADIYGWGSVPVTVPTGLAAFPGELFNMPKTTVTDRYVNIIHFNCDLPRGGHFAAFEEPELLAKDLFTFVHKVEEVN